MSRQGYEATMHADRSVYGVELDIRVPQSDSPVVVAQDVYGERQELMQLLVYPATDEAGETEHAVSVRISPDGAIAALGQKRTARCCPPWVKQENLNNEISTFNNAA